MVLAAGGMEAHDVEVSGGAGHHLLQLRCQGAVEAARSLHTNLDFAGRLLSYELATEEVAPHPAHPGPEGDFEQGVKGGEAEEAD